LGGDDEDYEDMSEAMDDRKTRIKTANGLIST